MMSGPVWYQTKPLKFGIFSVQYQNADAGVSLLDAHAQLCSFMHASVRCKYVNVVVLFLLGMIFSYVSGFQVY
jgi:hypothetical protein